MDVKELIKNAPQTSGVYLMKNKLAKVIYVGKAVNLKRRIANYFSGSLHLDIKTLNLVNNISSVEYIKTANEAGALLLENALIKKYKPKYNISLKDDKSYPAIIITKEPFPRIFIGRPYRQVSNFKYYGPYADARLLKEAFKILRRIFKFRTCKTLPKRPCLYSKLSLCYAPCLPAGRQVPSFKAKYRRIINDISLFLEGRYEELIALLTKKMFEAAKLKHFEEAKGLRDEITALGSLFTPTPKSLVWGFNLEDKVQDELESLKKILSLKKLPQRIEAFDISSIGESFKVGSMVYFYKGLPDKSNYRRFRIKTVLGTDDYSCLKEVLFRRYFRLLKERAFLPDLILIDGGKGHLSVALDVLKELKLDIPAISIAKENEIIFTPTPKSLVWGFTPQDKFREIILSRDSSALKLIQRLRDEAHRFAHRYHSLLRKKHLLQ